MLTQHGTPVTAKKLTLSFVIVPSENSKYIPSKTIIFDKYRTYFEFGAKDCSTTVYSHLVEHLKQAVRSVFQF